MRIETLCDLRVAWMACTTLGKIFFFWLMAIGWFILLIVSVYLNTVVNLGCSIGFLEYDESEED
jgi:hypothetical protein